MNIVAGLVFVYNENRNLGWTNNSLLITRNPRQENRSGSDG